MAEAKKAAKKAAKKSAPKKSALEALQEAVEAARKDGWAVTCRVDRMDDSGVSEGRNI